MNYRSLKGWKYELLEEMACETIISVGLPLESKYITILESGLLIVRAHYAWDGPSGPTFDTPTNMRASLFHDALCQLIREGLLDTKYRKYADELLRVHMLEDQVKNADGVLPVRMKSQPTNTKKMTGWKRAAYLRWGRFRANGYYHAVRGYSRLKGM